MAVKRPHLICTESCEQNHKINTNINQLHITNKFILTWLSFHKQGILALPSSNTTELIYNTISLIKTCERKDKAQQQTEC